MPNNHKKRAPARTRKPLASTDQLAAASYNPRRIDDDAAAGLAHSLTTFGDIAGIVFNVRTGRLVSGHQRVAQLTKQYGKLPIKDGAIVTPKGDTFAVRVVDWDEAKEMSANLAANSPVIAGEFTDALEEVIARIQKERPEDFEPLRLEALSFLSPDPILAADDADDVTTHRATRTTLDRTYQQSNVGGNIKKFEYFVEQKDYDAVVAALDAVRKQYDLETNSEAVVALLLDFKPRKGKK